MAFHLTHGFALGAGWGTANVDNIVGNDNHVEFRVNVTGGVPADNATLIYTFKDGKNGKKTILQNLNYKKRGQIKN